ncbi:hypothetical protein AA0114_g258 [Alternaria tenuissima]|uniref:Uncharacterized protein n=1 Tax=Alternaria tenuissima TaxID=119927 RepID=A0A4Q4MYK1_9PLEO|nr:hypothetical protein AA0114_g258 [Alternaria tenuissima]
MMQPSFTDPDRTEADQTAHRDRTTPTSWIQQFAAKDDLVFAAANPTETRFDKHSP